MALELAGLVEVHSIASLHNWTNVPSERTQQLRLLAFELQRIPPHHQ